MSSFTVIAAPQGVSSDGLWKDVAEVAIPSPAAGQAGQRVLFPTVFRTVALDVTAFRGLVANAPLELTPAAAAGSPSITMPMPDGSFARFHIQESPIMEPDLAAQLPDVKTYRIEGIDDPTATGRLDFTPEGFHGFILSPAGTVFIDPYQRGDTAHYMSYWRHDYARPTGAPPFHCDFAHENRPAGTSARKVAATSKHVKPLSGSGATLRTYRLALACTGEYAAYYGGTVSGAQAGMVTTMNRVNGIYERDVAVRMTMVNNTSIVFTNATTDPYTNDYDLDANQATIDSKIGSANYDIGHLFGTGGGGVAYLGVVCEPGWKALGLTGSPSPIGDAFNVDYVAHEMGHQFNADHTFNGTTSNCGFGNRWGPDAYEPGSGSTIMAYAGICSFEDLQPHSDPYFHARSYDEIIDYVTFGGGSNCPVTTSTGNPPPVVSAGPGITIPKSTPFYLTGSATDIGPFNPSYCWEEFDLGAPSPPNTDDGSRPIFRSFSPTGDPTRIFPLMANILSGVPKIGESLPTTTRMMWFRLTVRDNRTGGGGVDSAYTTVSVTSAAGPFVVTAPNTSNVTWNSGATHSVAWNPAGTAGPPVNCPNVKISLLTNSGNSLPTTLAASTPNDGLEAVTVPGITTTSARVRVDCITTPFFNISKVNFSIASSMGVVATALSPTSVAVSWDSVPRAVTYDVYRSSSLFQYSKIGSTTTTSFTDDTAVAGTAYLYAVKSLESPAAPSPMSSPDLATTVFFTDPALTPQSTIIQAIHFSELRTAVSAVGALGAVSAAPFTDPTLIAGTTTIKLVHLSELRAILDAARANLGLSPVAYTDPVLTPQSTMIKAAHLTDLRSGVQ